MPQALCDPFEVVADTPCLNCFSETQLNQLELLMWFYLVNGAVQEGDIQDMIDECKCRPCLTDKQMLVVEINAMHRFLSAFNPNHNIGYFITRAKWLQSIKPSIVRASISCIQCTYFKTTLEYYEGRESCDIYELIELNPCLHCMSVTELNKVLLALWVYALYGPFDWEDMITRLELCICRTCFTDKQLHVDLLNSMWFYINKNLELDDFLDLVKCLHCIPPGIIRALISCNKCTFWNQAAA